MRNLLRTAVVSTAALLATGVGMTAAQAIPVTTVGTDNVTSTLTANDVSMSYTYYNEICGSEIVPPVRGTTPFAFDTQQCISGLLHCVTYTPAGHGTRITWYADRVDCQTL
jgi:hypothetical protein